MHRTVAYQKNAGKRHENGAERQGDIRQLWDSNIFGKSLNELAEEGLTAKLEALPEDTKQRLQDTLQRIINEGSGGLICILL